MTTAQEDILRRIRGEYLEMPGLRLTSVQAQRLWGLDARTCASVCRMGPFSKASLMFLLNSVLVATDFEKTACRTQFSPPVIMKERSCP